MKGVNTGTSRTQLEATRRVGSSGPNVGILPTLVLIVGQSSLKSPVQSGPSFLYTVSCVPGPTNTGSRAVNNRFSVWQQRVFLKGFQP